MEVRQTGLDGVLELVPRKFADSRGFFSETYNAAVLRDAGIDLVFVQDNHSLSVPRGVLRGLHYQLPPRAQDKLVRVVKGAIFDVAVDIRRSSPTFGKWVGIELSAEKWNQLLVPKGFAHGFVTLVDNTEVVYKVTDAYSREHDRAIRFDDPRIAVTWPVTPEAMILSDKDRAAPLLEAADIFD
ncbi:MAG: dTDP-4-dehydrorhamnose 3,5-epimerase [Rhizobiaceae bacterium]|nr:MAG: dTDP-4-dehydrorhamnose 3,5-epimerase [Rhizobiaceae bacterium]CAG0993524.1 dTDP-4-dehydrorhamnose 3,5-epimerase [Rhizobiaceae bacterium]